MNETCWFSENICKLLSFSNVSSLAAIIISFFSLLYILIKDWRLKKLREDKSVLYPLLHENYDYILQATDKYDSDNIGKILKSLATSKLHNNLIKQKIDDINRGDEPIFLQDGGRDYALNTKIEELFKEIRHYLAEVIP